MNGFETTVVNEPSEFEPLGVYCNMLALSISHFVTFSFSLKLNSRLMF